MWVKVVQGVRKPKRGNQKKKSVGVHKDERGW